MNMIRAWVGNVLIVASLVGLVSLMLWRGAGQSAIDGEASAFERSTREPSPTFTAGDPPSKMTSEIRRVATRSHRAISRVVIHRIGLDAPVVPALMEEQEGGRTWQVTPFSAGHAEGTASAGNPGNAVLFGHVSSRTEGNVFRDLERVVAGDLVSIYAEAERFDYRVSMVKQVSRDDVSVVEQTERPSLSLITCAGLWMPFIWDYVDRLVVRAELMSGV